MCTAQNERNVKVMRELITRESGYIQKRYEVEICEEVEEYVYVTCPCCGGSGAAEGYYNDINGGRIYVESADCSLCNGSGSYEIYACQEVDTTTILTEEVYVETYQEGCADGDSVCYGMSDLNKAIERYKRLNGIVDSECGNDSE